MGRINRRRQILFSVGVLLGAPFASAQQARKRFRIGWFSAVLSKTETLKSSPSFAGFVAELRTLGYDQEALDFDILSADGRAEKYGDVAAALVRGKPDVIVVTGSQVAVATKKTTTTIPIVLCASADPVKYGLVGSLARPGGNVTGLSADAGPEIESKRLQLLKEVVPSISRVCCLATTWIWEGPLGRELDRSGKLLGLETEFAQLLPTDLHATFERVKAQRTDALFVLLAPEVYAVRRQITEFSLSARLPTAVPYAEMAAAGCLMSYGFNLPELGRLAARYVDKILKGAKPSELPVQLPNKFELFINAKTARTLGIKIPQSILLRADRVIE